MISKSTAKFIKSLQLKKYRKQEQCFLVEGAKTVQEVIASDYEVKLLIATESFLHEHKIDDNIEVQVASPRQLTDLGTYKNNDTALAVVRMQEQEEITINQDEWYIMLDDINDPGNFGSILRIADWYGISNVVASEQTADFYNPKTIAASKGSFCRVKVNYGDIQVLLRNCPAPIYGAMMEGEDVHRMQFQKGGVLIMGNEANGISAPVAASITNKITIPRYGGAESLNVAMATAVICDNIKRSQS